MTTNRLNQLKSLVVDYGISWRKRITWKNPVFWKLHILECRLVPFAEKYGMCGRVNAEGFESKHYQMSSLKTMLAPIVNTGTRVNKLSQRQQVYLITGMSESLERIAPKKGPSRGPYASRGRTRIQEVAEIISEDFTSDAPDDCFITAQGNLLPLSCHEAYNFYQKGELPESFSAAFEDDAMMSGWMKENAKYLN